jgi:hypothetical protein
MVEKLTTGGVDHRMPVEAPLTSLLVGAGRRLAVEEPLTSSSAVAELHNVMAAVEDPKRTS